MGGHLESVWSSFNVRVGASLGDGGDVFGDFVGIILSIWNLVCHHFGRHGLSRVLCVGISGSIQPPIPGDDSKDVRVLILLLDRHSLPQLFGANIACFECFVYHYVVMLVLNASILPVFIVVITDALLFRSVVIRRSPAFEGIEVV